MNKAKRPKNLVIYFDKNGESTREKVLQRDGYKCVRCGSTRWPMVHHKDDSRKLGWEKMNNEMDNLETLCRPCHAESHGLTTALKSPTVRVIAEQRMLGYTFAQIGDNLGISRQRVHQIYKKAIISGSIKEEGLK